MERGSSRLSLPLRHGLLGLALGLALLLAPEALGQGTGWLALATTPLLFPEAVLYLLLAKGLLLVLALGSRAPGGLLTPASSSGGSWGPSWASSPSPPPSPGRRPWPWPPGPPCLRAWPGPPSPPSSSRRSGAVTPSCPSSSPRSS
ncbi:hypothetical protein [Thermus thermophilus HB8]|uniref:Uncharacterized protein n=1 Tax=Thermus thermophilus (strain ATCC 27634 / DSM 579 / HB8) TaxID=300852 RepID=Q5SJY2_THET8|nr:hypothetical protein [Thermus thermophilus HB8]